MQARPDDLKMEVFAENKIIGFAYPCLEGFLYVRYALQPNPILVRCDYATRIADYYVVYKKTTDDSKHIYYVSWLNTDEHLECSHYTLSKRITQDRDKQVAIFRLFNEMQKIARDTLKCGVIERVENFESFNNFVVKYGNELKRQEDIPPPAYTPRELPPAYTPPIELKDGKITEFPVISKLVHYDEKLCLSCFVGDFQLLMNYIIESNGQVMFHVGFIDNVHTKVRVYKGLPSTKINFNLSIEFDIACFLHEYVGKQYDEQHNMFELMKEFYRTAYKISKNKALIRPMNDFFSRPYGFRY